MSVNQRCNDLEQAVEMWELRYKNLKTDLESLQYVHGANLDRVLAEMRRADAADAKLRPLQEENEKLRHLLHHIQVVLQMFDAEVNESLGEANVVNRS